MKAATPPVSILMPVYNAERYVAEAVESILTQTYRDFEFIIIDDGSTDGSLAVLQSYAARDPRIRLISRPNTGLVGTLNKALQSANGIYIARMDADDISCPDRFRIQADYLDAHPEVVCVAGAVMTIDASGRDLLPGHEGKDHEQIVDEALSGHCPLSHPSVMMRREALTSIGGYRPEAWPAEDLDLWLRLAERGRLVNLPEVVLRYRLHDKSVSEQHQHQQLERSRFVSDEACSRRGIPPRFVSRPPWRPIDRRTRVDSMVRFGWVGFCRGDRRMALAYGLKAIGLAPWRTECWRLLGCSLLKSTP